MVHVKTTGLMIWGSQVSKITVKVIMAVRSGHISGHMSKGYQISRSLRSICFVTTQTERQTWSHSGVWNTGEVKSWKLIDHNNLDWKTYWIFLHGGRWESGETNVIILSPMEVPLHHWTVDTRQKRLNIGILANQCNSHNSSLTT